MLDLSTPEHREALRWAAVVRAGIGTPTEQAASCPIVQASGALPILNAIALCKAALMAIDSPSDSAAIVRAELERCGAAVDIDHHRGAQWRIVYYLGGVRMWFAVNYANGDMIPDIFALILRLLACTTKEEALAALREVGR